MRSLRLLSHIVVRPTRAMSVSVAEHSVVYVTAPSDHVARRLAAALVREHHLAACVNIVPGVTSVYEWEGAVQEDTEALMIIKTRTDMLAELTAVVRRNHPYECPEVVALPIQGGSDQYLKWVSNTVQVPKPK